jgi:acyl carrier protein
MNAIEMNAIEQTIRQYLESSLFADGPAANGNGSLACDDDLLTILDSLQVLRMLLDLEAQYAIKVDNSELTPENLGTIRRLAEFIAKKREEAACQAAK